MNAVIVFSLLGFVVMLSLGVFVLSKDPRSLLHRLFFAYCVAGTVGFFIEFNVFRSETLEAVSFWAGFICFFAVLLSVQLHFVLVFIGKRDFVKKRSVLFLIYAPAALVSFAGLNGGGLSRLPEREAWGWMLVSPEITPVVVIGNVWIVSMALLPLFLSLGYYFKTADDRKRKQALFVFIGLCTNMAWSVITQGVLPTHGIRFPPLASTGALLGSIFFGYAIVRHGLFALTPKTAAEGILSTMTDALFLVTRNRAIAVANGAAAHMLGYDEVDLVGISVDRIFENSSLLSSLEHILNKKDSVSDIEGSLLAKDGSAIAVSLSASIMRNHRNRVLGTIYVSRDITERKRAEEELRKAKDELEIRVKERAADLIETNRRLQEEIEERKRVGKALRSSEARYREIFDSVIDGLIILTTEGRVVEANPQACEMLTISPEEITSLAMRDLVESKDRMNIDGFFGNVGTKGFAHRESVRMIRGGSSFVADLKGTIFDYEDEPHVLMIVRDLTEKQKLEAQLQQAQKMEAIGTLAGGIAHDFNNILTSIIGYAELVQDDVSHLPQVQDNLFQVLQAGSRAKELVKQILTFSRQEKNEHLPIELHSIIKEALKLLRSTLPATIEIVPAIASSGTIKGNATQMHQVLMNLCTNSYHAMMDTGGTLEVSLSTIVVADEAGQEHRVNGSVYSDNGRPNVGAGTYLRLAVSDTGHGMSPEVIDRIFDPYFSTKPKDQGVGLGLSVVHGIVRSHGGAITVHSVPAEGSTVSVYLPQMDIHEKRPTEKPGEELVIGTERIMFVDDEPPIAKLGKQLLERLGYSVEARTSSIEALELFKAKPEYFDLIITDMTMPYLTGDNLAREIFKIREKIPIILCTGFSEQITEEKAARLGISAFLMKPLVKRELSEAVRKALADS